MKSLADARAALVSLLNGDVKAYGDPRGALANRPCLLVGHPVVDWSEGTLEAPLATWFVFALSSYQGDEFEALDQLTELIGVVDAAGVLDKAEPVQFRVRDGSLIAAYRLTVTEVLQ